jgi:hypothetical protein
MRTLRQDTRQLVALFVALTPGIVVLGMPTEGKAQSTTISGVTVQIGTRTFQLWSPQAISAGQTLVLAQNPTPGSTPFNFDTSDEAAGSCLVAMVSGTATSSGLSTNFSFSDSTQVLTPEGCPGNSVTNEAQIYAQIGQFNTAGLQITVFVGYADDDHSDACGLGLPNGSSTCFPSPFGNTATFFQGTAQTNGPGLNCFHPEIDNSGTCYDSGVILFKATPIPANACPLTQGFWKNHFPGSWPSSVIANGLKIGSKTYTANQLETNLETPPAGGNALLILSHQLIAAKLNILNGSNPTPIAATITQADALIDGLNINVDFVAAGSSLGQQMTALADTLDSFNSSLLTPTCTGPQ